MAAQGISQDAPVHETLGQSALRGDEGFAGPSPFPPADLDADLEDAFEVRGELGRGGMATVLLASQRALSREVAIKRASDPDDEDAEVLLLREATLTGQLEHPNIVP